MWSVPARVRVDRAKLIDRYGMTRAPAILDGIAGSDESVITVIDGRECCIIIHSWCGFLESGTFLYFLQV
jgi:hypothetical protein